MNWPKKVLLSMSSLVLYMSSRQRIYWKSLEVVTATSRCASWKYVLHKILDPQGWVRMYLGRSINTSGMALNFIFDYFKCCWTQLNFAWKTTLYQSDIGIRNIGQYVNISLNYCFWDWKITWRRCYYMH